MPFLNFANRTMTIGMGEGRFLQSSQSGHPVVRLTDFPEKEEVHVHVAETEGEEHDEAEVQSDPDSDEVAEGSCS